MIAARLREVSGVRIRGDGDTVFTHVARDSRSCRPGSLFVALRGRNADGRDFVADAARHGAVAALGRGPFPGPAHGLVLLEAHDPLASLHSIAAGVRRRSSAKVVGIAGAAGKTTTKDVVRALCAPHAPTIASPLSFNNELGVPLTLCRIEPETAIAVAELGTGAPGELRALAALARPDVGVVTSVGPEHLVSFGSVSGAARAEAELIEALRPGAMLVLPAGARRLARFVRADLTTITFGDDRRADVHALAWLVRSDRTHAVLSVGGRRVPLVTSLRAPQHRLALCAAAAVFAALGLPLERIGGGADAVALSPYRGQERVRAQGGIVVNDAYNANPLSMRAALAALAERRSQGRTVAVLGEMAELGPRAAAWHRLAGRQAVAAGVSLLVGVGPAARDYLAGAAGAIASEWFADVEAAVRGLPALLRPGDVVLLKASRAAALERLEDAAA